MSVLVLVSGHFGVTVGQHLGDLIATLEPQVSVLANDSSFLPEVAGVTSIILAVSRPAPLICQTLSNLAFSLRVPFMALVNEGAELTLGPIVVPEGSGCWSCWVARRSQQELWSNERNELYKAYQADKELELRGFLEPFASLAAAKIAGVYQQTWEDAAGKIWQYNMFTGDVKVGRLAGVHGCATCGLGRYDADRTYKELLPFIGSIS